MWVTALSLNVNSVKILTISVPRVWGPLLIDNRYRLVKPLRQLDLRNYTDIFEVDDGEAGSHEDLER